MSTKDNFSQAMKELLNGDAPVEKEEKKPAPSSFSSFSRPEPKPPRAPAPTPQRDRVKAETIERPQPKAVVAEIEEVEVVEVAEAPVAAPAPAPAPAPEYQQPVAPAPAPAPAPVAYTAPQSIFAAPAPAPAPAPMQPAPMAPVAPVMADTNPVPVAVGAGETTVIAPGTTVLGDVTTAGGLRVGGSVKGNVKVASMMELNGNIIGDIEAADAVIVGSLIRGNVTISNVLTMDGDTTIVGDVSAKNLDSNGKIKGNLTVEERSHFQTNAVLAGNLVSGTVIIDEGAMLKGDIAITSAADENVTVEEPDFDIG